MRAILNLNLHREFFTQIAAGTKRTEYNSRTPYWRRRLEGRHYDAIQSRRHLVLARQVRNGYATQAPEMLVEFRGLRRYGKGRNAYYAIRPPLAPARQVRLGRREGRGEGDTFAPRPNALGTIEPTPHPTLSPSEGEREAPLPTGSVTSLYPRETSRKQSKERRIDLVFSKLSEPILAAGFGGGEFGRKMAAMITTIKFDLPLHGQPKPGQAQTPADAAPPAGVAHQAHESNHSQSNQSKSN